MRGPTLDVRIRLWRLKSIPAKEEQLYKTFSAKLSFLFKVGKTTHILSIGGGGGLKWSSINH